MFGESKSIKPEEGKRPAGVSPSSRQTPTRISSSPFSSTMARTPEQPRKALGKASESNNSRRPSTRIVERVSDEGSSQVWPKLRHCKLRTVAGGPRTWSVYSVAWPTREGGEHGHGDRGSQDASEERGAEAPRGCSLAPRSGGAASGEW